ncbi:hypothetical protein BDF19DRAFT_448267 [Syncephalis fuscata]|nr:hypothetical protein BDF19DRAFT_448267 [Syncephalis fuscata]
MRIVGLTIFFYQKTNSYISSLLSVISSESIYITLSWIAIATFCLLFLWLGSIFYKLRKHPDGRRKFTQVKYLI